MNSIRNLEELLSPSIFTNSLIVDHKFSKLTEPGENYASLIRALQVNIRNPDGTKEAVHIVAKQIPENVVLQNMFKTQSTFVKEMSMYAEIIPILMNFQKDQNMQEAIDFFPKYYGGRRNLNGSEVVDEDGVILLENLKLSGYSTWDRLKGFNLDDAKAVLKTLATFHAVPLAFKQKHPDTFEKKIAARIPLVHLFGGPKDEFQIQVTLRIEKFAREVEGADEKFVERVMKAVERCFDLWPKTPESIFNTVVHSDFWTNNIMVQMVDGKIIDHKMVDFQFTECNSLGKDVVFFLYTSIQVGVIEDHYEQLVKFYYDNLIEALRKIGCDVRSYTFEAFEEQLALCVRRSEFVHCLLMTKAIYAVPQNVKDLENLSKDDMILCDEPSEAEFKKAEFIIKQFAKRNWI